MTCTSSNEEEWQQLVAGVWIQNRYDSAVKADLYSTAIRSDAGLFLIDPIFPAARFVKPARDQQVAGVVVSNANHARAARDNANRLEVPIYANTEAGIAESISITTLGERSAEFKAVFIEGAAPGEIALFCATEGGTLVIGDALINFGPHGFTFLPAKYCLSPKVMRQSLRQLLEFSFERILFAHGAPIVTKARERLIALLQQEQ